MAKASVFDERSEVAAAFPGAFLDQACPADTPGILSTLAMGPLPTPR